MKGLRGPAINVLIAGVVIGLAIWLKLLGLGEGIQILILLGLVFVTAQYAKSAESASKAAIEQAEASKQMVEELRLTREIQNMPSIIAYFDNPQSSLLELVVKNIGNGAAKDVTLSIEPPLYDYRERNVADLSLFKKGIRFFPPNRELRQIIGIGKHFFGEGSQRPLEYNLKLSYYDVSGNLVADNEVIPLDLSIYRDLPIHRKSDVDKLTEEVQRLADTLRNIKL